MEPLKVLVVDDSSMYRQILSEIVNSIPELNCVGAACNGREALTQIERIKPDVVTLDIEMPVMTGMEVIEALKLQGTSAKILLLSAHSQAGAELTVQALALGAFDFITKPENLRGGNAREQISDQLRSKLLGVRWSKDNSQKTCAETQNRTKPEPLVKPFARPTLRPQAVVIGSSTGGPKALLRFFEQLPGDLGVSLFVVQHMPALFTKSFAESLNQIAKLTVKEAENDEPVVSNCVYLAPGGKQMALTKTPKGMYIRVDDAESDNGIKPSVDYFFSSVADAYRERAVGVILSGMGCDGTEGLRKMKAKGALVLGQNEESCVVYGMPRAAKEAGLVDSELALNELPAAIETLLRPHRSRC